MEKDAAASTTAAAGQRRWKHRTPTLGGAVAPAQRARLQRRTGNRREPRTSRPVPQPVRASEGATGKTDEQAGTARPRSAVVACPHCHCRPSDRLAARKSTPRRRWREVDETPSRALDAGSGARRARATGWGPRRAFTRRPRTPAAGDHRARTVSRPRQLRDRGQSGWEDRDSTHGRIKRNHYPVDSNAKETLTCPTTNKRCLI